MLLQTHMIKPLLNPTKELRDNGKMARSSFPIPSNVLLPLVLILSLPQVNLSFLYNGLIKSHSQRGYQLTSQTPIIYPF